MRFTRTLFVALALAPSGSAGADVIADWNQKALPIVAKYSLGGPAYRDMAMMNIAMYQRVNSIEPSFEPYKAKIAGPPTASKEAGPGSPRRPSWGKLHPDDQAGIDAQLREYLAQIPDGSAKDQGGEFGQRVADGVLTMRANGGAAAADNYRPCTSAGQYVATAPVVDLDAEHGDVNL